MFILKKIVSPFLLPPGIFIVLLIASGVWFLYKKRWSAGIVNCVIGSLIWAVSIAPVSDTLLRGLEGDFKIPQNPKGDIIILLGGGVYDGVADMSGTGSPSEDMLGRIVTAVRLQKNLDIPVIISGGSVYKGKEAEAPIVKRFLTDLGVPENKVIMEDKSRDTIENARYTKEICFKAGFKRPILVTSAYHMKRSLASFEKAGMDVTAFPAQFKTRENKKYGWEDYLPGGLGSTSVAMHEYLGLLFYKFAY
ncbi:MAG: YdcF family protein [Nitrospirae bacterium]|nr:YdcF family protein [Nitrospirota bacterium]